MSFVKRSVGSIVAVVDGDEVELREATAEIMGSGKLVSCDGCGIRHLVGDGDVLTCECGGLVASN